MNVTQMAKHLGTSKPTLYKRVKLAGLDLDELRDKDTGELTDSGTSAIAALFDDYTPVLTEKREANHSSAATVDAELTAARQQIEALQREIDLLREMLDGKNAELARMAEDLTAWRAKAQEINVQQLLLTMDSTRKRSGLMNRIMRVFGKGGDE